MISNYILVLSTTGSPGERGPQGPRGPRGQPGKSVDGTGGVVYTRWGRKMCPNTNETTKLYSGNE